MQKKKRSNIGWPFFNQSADLYSLCVVLSMRLGLVNDFWFWLVSIKASPVVLSVMQSRVGAPPGEGF